MADYDMKPLKWAKTIPSITSIQSECDKRMRVNAEKHKKVEDKYNEGADYYIQGKRLVDACNEEGKMTEDELKAFTNGYMSMPISKAKSYAKSKVSTKDKEKYDTEIGFWFGKMRFEDLPIEFSCNNNCITGYGKGFGYDGAIVSDLPKKYVGKKAFLIGYRTGIQERALEDKESKKRR